MINNKILNLLGITTKAGKLVAGAEAVKEAITKNKVKLIILAKDCSQNTKDIYTNLSDKFNIPIMEFENMENISKSIGKSNKAVVGIKDKNLSNEILKIFNGGENIG